MQNNSRVGNLLRKFFGVKQQIYEWGRNDFRTETKKTLLKEIADELEIKNVKELEDLFFGNDILTKEAR